MIAASFSRDFFFHFQKCDTIIETPLILVGLLSLLSGLLCFLLPETQDVPLPDTVAQMGRKAKKNKIGVERCDYEKSITGGKPSEREVLREKLFSEEWVDAGNGIIVNFSDKN